MMMHEKLVSHLFIETQEAMEDLQEGRTLLEGTSGMSAYASLILKLETHLNPNKINSLRFFCFIPWSGGGLKFI